jgi:hypothetical protein
MSDYIEIELASGLNRVLYKNPHAGVEVKPGAQLFIRNNNDNEHTSIGTLAEVRVASQKKVNEVWSGLTGFIGTVDLLTGNFNTPLFAKPPTVGGKRKTRKYKRKNKRKTRKYKKR